MLLMVVIYLYGGNLNFELLKSRLFNCIFDQVFRGKLLCFVSREGFAHLLFKCCKEILKSYRIRILVSRSKCTQLIIS